MGFFIFGTFIPYYGLCIVIGIVCAFLICFFLCKKNSLNTDDLIIICAYLVSFGFIGAKILYIIVSIKSINFKEVFSSMKAFNAFLSSGFVFYGGLIGGIFALWLVKKVHKIDVIKYIPELVPGLCIAHSCGRIGCSLAGCCHGKITTGRLYFRYSHSIAAPNNVNLFPVQGIEAFLVFLIGLICFIIVLKKIKFNVLYLYIAAYSVIRFILEFFRGDKERGFFLVLSTSQIISILGLLIVLVKCVSDVKHRRRRPWHEAVPRDKDERQRSV